MYIEFYKDFQKDSFVLIYGKPIPQKNIYTQSFVMEYDEQYTANALERN